MTLTLGLQAALCPRAAICKHRTADGSVREKRASAAALRGCRMAAHDGLQPPLSPETEEAVVGALMATAAAINVATQFLAGNTTTNPVALAKMIEEQESNTEVITAVVNGYVNDPLLVHMTDMMPSTQVFGMRRMSSQWYIKPRSKMEIAVQNEDMALWKQFFRVSKSCFEYICSLVAPELQSRTPDSFKFIGGRVITVDKQVAIALRRLSHGEGTNTVGDMFGVAKNTVSKITWRFVKAITKLGGHHLQWPQGSDMGLVKEGIRNLRGFPNCCGVMDVTHIQIELPAGNSAADWEDREHNYSMILQAIVDSNYRFLDVFAGCPGSVYDSRVLRISGFYRDCESGLRLNGPHELLQAHSMNEYVIGDSAFPLLPWLITPYSTAEIGFSSFKHEFNVKHAVTRAVVDEAFARLKGAWRILHGLLRHPDIQKLSHIIFVCCLLHNIMIDTGEEFDENTCPLVGHHDEGYFQQISLTAEEQGKHNRAVLTDYLPSIDYA